MTPDSAKFGEVLMDHQTIGETAGGLLKGNEKLSVVVLDEPEPKTSDDFIVINLFQFFPVCEDSDRMINAERNYGSRYNSMVFA